MTITLEVGGRRYSNWTDVEVTRALDEVSGSFKFISASDYKQPFPIPRGESVKVFVNSTQVMTGYVDRIQVSYSDRGHTITVEGRDKTADIVDSKVDHKIEFKAPITLQDVATQTLSAIGASDVQVINNVSDIEPFTKGELISANIGQAAFDFINQYAKKRQVTLTTDGKGNLVMTRASTESTNIQLNNVVGGSLNTIKTGKVSYDDSQRFNKYTFYSQGNPSGDKDASESSKQLTDRTQSYTDSEVRASRQYHEISESSSKEKHIKDRAKWEGLIRKAKSFKYDCTVVGHSPTDGGAAYIPNTLVNVKDDFCDVYEELLVVKVTYLLSNSDGSTVSLEMLTKEAYQLLESDSSEQNGKTKKGRTSKYTDDAGNVDSKAFDSEFAKYKKK